MTPAQAHKLFLQLRSCFATHRPDLKRLRLVLRRRHFLAHPKPRDLAWYETSDGTVNLMVQALHGPSGRVEGLLAHELGHALDLDPSQLYAERRADKLAKQVLGVPVRYDQDDVQNLLRGVSPRPSRLPENRGKQMKRNPNEYTKAQYPYEVFYQRTVKGKVVTGSVPVATKREANECVHGMMRSPNVIEAFVRRRNPSHSPARNPSFAKWLDTFLEEKGIDMEEVLEVEGRSGTNWMPVGVLVSVMKRAPEHEQKGIKTMLVKIDFYNAPVLPYLAHLAQAIAR